MREREGGESQRDKEKEKKISSAKHAFIFFLFFFFCIWGVIATVIRVLVCFFIVASTSFKNFIILLPFLPFQSMLMIAVRISVFLSGAHPFHDIFLVYSRSVAFDGVKWTIPLESNWNESTCLQWLTKFLNEIGNDSSDQAQWFNDYNDVDDEFSD